MTRMPEKKESLWRIIVSPMVWSAHFLACYVAAAVWCAKFAGPIGSLRPARWAILIFTVVALTVIVLNGWGGWKRHRHGEGEVPHDLDTPEDRHRFLGFSTVLLAGLSAIATLFEAMVIIFFKDCR